MKEQIQKLAGLNKEVVDLVKEEKMDEVVEKLAEIQELTKEMEENAETPATDPETTPTDGDGDDNKGDDDAGDKTPVEKSEKVEITKEALDMINKWASMNISAESVAKLLEEFAGLKEQMQKSTEDLANRLDVVEKAKGISKQADEEIKKKSESVWDGLPL